MKRLATSLLARCHGGLVMLLEIVRLGAAFGTMGLVIRFWYWFMESLGTF